MKRFPRTSHPREEAEKCLFWRVYAEEKVNWLFWNTRETNMQWVDTKFLWTVCELEWPVQTAALRTEPAP